MPNPENESRGFQLIGGFLIIGGALVLTAFGLFVFGRDFLGDPDVPYVVKIGLPAVAGGVIALFAGALRDRLRRRKTEGLEEVKW